MLNHEPVLESSFRAIQSTSNGRSKEVDLTLRLEALVEQDMLSNLEPVLDERIPLRIEEVAAPTAELPLDGRAIWKRKNRRVRSSSRGRSTLVQCLQAFLSRLYPGSGE